ncbi:unnamed protein product [Protopolystoma xenopodis]|uniref:Uncharacterized protein n=1 Tax=Protopolystoma xenopodis TaxID=117903 RepID=A0A3S5BDH2_9PLAT|nr:unnamed protein product [Protopolystoma xenopodis]
MLYVRRFSCGYASSETLAHEVVGSSKIDMQVNDSTGQISISHVDLKISDVGVTVEGTFFPPEVRPIESNRGWYGSQI